MASRRTLEDGGRGLACFIAVGHLTSFFDRAELCFTTKTKINVSYDQVLIKLVKYKIKMFYRSLNGIAADKKNILLYRAVGRDEQILQIL